MYSRSAFAPITTSQPNHTFRTDVFGRGAGTSVSVAQMYSTSPTAERHPADRTASDVPSLSASVSDPSVFAFDHQRPTPAIVIRKLPRNFTNDALMSMLIFAGDMLDTELVQSHAEDHGFSTAVAYFRSQAGAIEAQQKLNGKPNTTREANMIVEVYSSGMGNGLERRATIDGTSSRNQTSSTSSGTSIGSIRIPTGRSRFGSTFQSNDKVSPPLATPSSTGSGTDLPMPGSSADFQNLFSPQSPLGNGFDDRTRVSGRSTINDNGVDDETSKLLNDPVAYAMNGEQQARRSTNHQTTLARFNGLSLSTSNGNGEMSSSAANLTSPRSQGAISSPLSPMNMTTNASNGTYASLNFPRAQYPPANPADQNPPCNTLYVGNLPIDTSEDELKAMFSKQRGYKRLCFRTKQNGPMCFVEFEDVSFATKALHELYGQCLHNSIKGGIRLSFSKNPLGVRSGQANGIAPSGMLPHQSMAPGYSNGMAGGPVGSYSSVTGPPPGLNVPPGLVNGAPASYRSAPPQVAAFAPPPPPISAMDGGMFANPFGMPSAPIFANQLGPRNLSGGLPPNISVSQGQFSGRDSRASYSKYMIGG